MSAQFCHPVFSSQYTVFDAAGGVVSSVLLIAGSLQSSQCLLVTWCLLSFCLALKHLWVVITHDWTSLEDWISISFLLFLSLVFIVVWSRILQINQERAAGGDTCGDQGRDRGKGSEGTNKVRIEQYTSLSNISVREI